MGFLLTAKERQRFADWLRQELESNRAIMPQLEKTCPVLAKQYRMEMAAAIVIHKKLMAIEEQTLSAVSVEAKEPK